jgi:hypothetical protein
MVVLFSELAFPNNVGSGCTQFSTSNPQGLHLVIRDQTGLSDICFFWFPTRQGFATVCESISCKALVNWLRTATYLRPQADKKEIPSLFAHALDRILTAYLCLHVTATYLDGSSRNLVLADSEDLRATSFPGK